MASFGKTISSARKAKNLSRQRLSELSGVPLGTIITTETERYLPRANTLYSLAKHLDLDIRELIFELEVEGKKRKNGKYFPKLQQYLKEQRIAQKHYAEIIGRSWSYLTVRFISEKYRFDCDDIKKTRDYFKLTPEEIVSMFIDHIDGDWDKPTCETKEE